MMTKWFAIMQLFLVADKERSMVEKAIENIKEVEKQAEEKICHAQEVSGKIIQDARKQAARLIDKEIIVAENKVAQLLSAAQEKGEKTAFSIKVEAEKEKEKILKNAHEKFDEALQCVTDKITHGYQ